MSRWLSAATTTDIFICYDINNRTYKTYAVLKSVFEETLPFQQDKVAQIAIDEVITDFPNNKTYINYDIDLDGKRYRCEVYVDKDDTNALYGNVLTQHIKGIHIVSIKKCALVTVIENIVIGGDLNSEEKLNSYIIAEVIAEDALN